MNLFVNYLRSICLIFLNRMSVIRFRDMSGLFYYFCKNLVFVDIHLKCFVYKLIAFTYCYSKRHYTYKILSFVECS